jgi:hypothetical protein
MSNDARTVFEAYKTTTLTFDCYGIAYRFGKRRLQSAQRHLRLLTI